MHRNASILVLLAALCGAAGAAGAIGAAGQAQGAREEPGEAQPPVGSILREAVSRAFDRGIALASALAGDGQQELEELFCRAGRPLPPGLPPQRAAERRSERDAAQRELAARLTPGVAGRDRAIALLRAGLDEAVSERAWVARALAAAELGIYDAIEEIARGLDPERPAPVRWAADEALFDLVGRRFRSRAEFSEFWATARVDARSTLLREPLRRALDEARGHLVRWLEREPSRAPEWLDDPDPRTREATARVVAGAIAGGDLDAAAGVRALIARVEQEPDPQAFAALLEGALDPLAGEPPDAAPVGALREALAATVNRREPWVEVSVARALAHLPWSAEGPEATRYERGLALVADLIGGLPTTGPFHDVDVTLGTFGALESLAAAAGTAGAPRPLGARARAVCADRMLDAAADPGVRVAAASALSELAGPDDMEVLLAALERPDATPPLRFEILGSLRRIGADPSADPAAVDALLERVHAILDDPDPDLRRQALDVLADPVLAPRAAGTQLDLWIARIDREPVDEIALGLLALVRSNGRASEVRPLLALERFEHFATGPDGRATTMAETLSELAGGSAVLLVDSGERLASIEDPPSRVERLRGALLCVASLSDDAAAGLDPDGHRRAVRWAVALLQERGELPVTTAGEPLLLRLVDVHLPGVAPADEHAPTAGLALHAAALFESELDLMRGSLDAAVVDARFQPALEWAATHPGEAAEDLVLRDRARLRAAAGNATGARADYALLAARMASGNGSAARLLDVGDLRLAAALIDELAAAAEAGSEVPWEEALRLSWMTIEHPDWARARASARLEDLRALARRADRADSSADRVRLAAWLDAHIAREVALREELQQLREQL